MTVDPHNLSGAYVLDALSEEERVAYEQHLAECPDCADEVAGFRETTARMGASDEQPTPAHLKRSVVEAVSRTAQERPHLTPERPRETQTLRAGRTRQVAARVGLAAAVLAVVVSVGWSVVEHNRNEELRAQQSGVSAVLSAPDATMKTKEMSGGTSVGIVRSTDMNKAVLVVKNLPRLDDERVYQMWTMSDGKPVPAGTMPGQGDGTSSHLMSGIADVSQVAITVEPEGGSEQPTTDPIAMLSMA